MRKTYFLTLELAAFEAGGINAICSRPEVAGDNISGYNLETFRDNEAANFRVASFSGFLENHIQPLM